jgi:hypothetical protein
MLNVLNAERNSRTKWNYQTTIVLNIRPKLFFQIQKNSIHTLLVFNCDVLGLYSFCIHRVSNIDV